MKSILLSIKPKWVAKILNGEKTIEIRKTMPKCDLPITVYIYCTKENATTKPLLLANKDIVSDNLLNQHNVRWLNGKVVAKFTVRKVEAIDIWQEDLEEKMKLACLSIKEFDNYSKGQVAYAYHIEDLVIFDKPKELSDFMPIKWDKCGVKDKNGLYQCDKCPYGEVLPYGSECHYKSLKRPPQNFVFVESEE